MRDLPTSQNFLASKYSCSPILGSRIQDSNIVRKMANLRQLNVPNTPVSDVGLENLKGLANLQWLILSRTKVTDVGLEHLKELTSLQKF